MESWFPFSFDCIWLDTHHSLEESPFMVEIHSTVEKRAKRKSDTTVKITKGEGQKIPKSRDIIYECSLKC